MVFFFPPTQWAQWHWDPVNSLSVLAVNGNPGNKTETRRRELIFWNLIDISHASTAVFFFFA